VHSHGVCFMNAFFPEFIPFAIPLLSV
jgi:hypothetical protein